jgi:hypothetical protein
VAWKDGLCESGLYKIDAGEVNLGKIESGSRYAGIYKLRLYKSANNCPQTCDTSTNSWDARDFLDSIYYVYDLTLESN